MIRVSAVSAAMVFTFLVPSFAAPKIEFDTKTFVHDTIAEDQVEKISAVFVIKNTGDQPLKLEMVRPGCGCTNVKFDSTIKPGKTSKMSAEVNIKGYRAGSVSKGITVVSNAANEKEIRLNIAVYITSPVELSDMAITFGGGDTSKIRSVKLISKKHDLYVKSVFFKETDVGNGAGWQTEVKVPVVYEFTPLDSMRSDGARYFLLKLTTPKGAKSSSGNMVLSTNHPEKPELTLQAYIVNP